MNKKRIETALKELKIAGSPGLDLSPGDPLCLEAATIIEFLRGERALARDTAFWSDCHYDKGIEEQGPRGADHCLHEGTHVCRACEIADLRREVKRLQAAPLRQQADRFMQEVSSLTDKLVEVNEIQNDTYNTNLLLQDERDQAAREVKELWVEGIRDRIRFHAHMYYNMNQSVISDGEYDSMFRHLQMIEREFPELLTPDSPTQLVGTGVSRPLREIR